MNVYCIEHEEMVRVEQGFRLRELIHDDGTPDERAERYMGHLKTYINEDGWEVDFCEFSQGFAYCPPPAFDMDEFMKTLDEVSLCAA